jgi:Glycosyl transferases group 1
MEVPRSARWIGHRFREVTVHAERILQNSELPRIIFCVDGGDDGMSSGLRGYALARELRKLRWRTIVIPKQLEFSQRQRIIRIERPDIIVLQQSRHPMNRPKYYKGSICVFDIDDADFVDVNAREVAVECMRESDHIVAGSRFISDYARQHNTNVNIVWTSSPPRGQSRRRKLDPPVVAWAVSSASGYPEELSLVISALNMVKSRNWQFWLFGAKDFQEGRLIVKPIEEKGILCRVFPFMDYETFLRTLEEVSVGLAPLVPSASKFSAGKSFGKVLGYLNCDVAIVASDAVDHPLFFNHGENGFLAADATQFADSIDLLLSNPALRQIITARARQDYLERLSIEAAARKMNSILRPLVDHLRSETASRIRV